jgi:uncharacterized protein YbjT (DUF2867 family)
MELLRSSPVVALPPWRKHRTQPIDIRDVFAGLVAAADNPSIGGQRLRIAGPEVVSWEALLREIASRLPGRHSFVPIPFHPAKRVQRYLTASNGGNPALMLPLLDSLKAGDVVPSRNDLPRLGISSRPLRETIDEAVAEYLDGAWQATEGSPFERP